MTHKWSEIKHKSSPAQRRRARLRQEVRLFPYRVRQGLSDAGKYGKVGLLLATLFVVAAVLATREGM